MTDEKSQKPPETLNKTKIPLYRQINEHRIISFSYFNKYAYEDSFQLLNWYANFLIRL